MLIAVLSDTLDIFTPAGGTWGEWEFFFRVYHIGKLVKLYRFVVGVTFLKTRIHPH